MARKTWLITGGIGLGVALLGIGGAIYVSMFQTDVIFSEKEERQEGTPERNEPSSVIESTRNVEGEEQAISQDTQSQDHVSEDNFSSDRGHSSSFGREQEFSEKESDGSSDRKESSTSESSQRDRDSSEQESQVTVTSPKEQTIWRSGTNQNLTWKGKNLDDSQISIVLTQSNRFCGEDASCRAFVDGNAPQYVLDTVKAKQREWSWEVPPLDGKIRRQGTYIFMLQDAEGEVLAKSETVVLMKPNEKTNLSFVWPNSDNEEPVTPGEDIIIAWKSSPDIVKLNIDLLRKGKVVRNISSGNHNGQLLSWKIPSGIDPGSYAVRVESQGIISPSVVRTQSITVEK